MLDFYAGAFDVLLCTTIIESGLDVPEANTLIVFDADRFGLSQLYQIRGRVGRSNRQAYAYFTVRRDKLLSETAEKRLSAIREFTEFGAGYRIALRDLEIRGAGDVLGPEQHGHLSAVGYDMYVKLIEQAVGEAQGREEMPELDTRVELAIDARSVSRSGARRSPGSCPTGPRSRSCSASGAATRPACSTTAAACSSSAARNAPRKDPASHPASTRARSARSPTSRSARAASSRTAGCASCR